MICCTSFNHCIAITHPLANIWLASLHHGSIGMTLLFLWRSDFIFIMSQWFFIFQWLLNWNAIARRITHTYFLFSWHTQKLRLWIKSCLDSCIFLCESINNYHSSFIRLYQNSWFLCRSYKSKLNYCLQWFASPMVLHCCCKNWSSESTPILMRLTFNHVVIKCNVL